MSSALMTTPVTATAQYRTVLAQIDPERAGKALADPALAAEYATELADGFQFLATIESRVEGQKALHGAYVYGMLSTAAVRGKVTIDGEKVALGQVVGAKLGRWKGRYNTDGSRMIEPLASGSVTRYRYISILVFDAQFSPADPEWSDLVNYYVSTPEMVALLKQHRDRDHKLGEHKITRDEVLAVVKALRTPVPAIAPPSTDDSTPDDSDDSQGSENSDDSTDGDDSTPDDSTPDADDSTPDSTPSGNAPLHIPAHEIDLPRGDAGKVQYAEAAIAGLTRENLTPELLKRLTVLAEAITVLVS